MKNSFSKPSGRIGRGVFYTASAPRRTAPRTDSLPRPPVTRTRSQNTDRSIPEYLPVDRRAFSPSTPSLPQPLKIRPAQRLNGVPATVVAPPPKKRAPAPSGTRPKLYSPQTLLFQNPTGVGVCVQRGIRKEVLHAQGVAGKKGLKPPKRGPYSNIRCK